ncbi:hypothetical protein INS49_014711 [Diaporthe citri]|uniref:uncharacterized protein n=1 Tax=Diaporthe citri TaxID=83186 RepID=UPI001C80C0F7|nr:uncharacterized protein INS49_014711 [Diaporthe citri]KAG6356837.1 hypothetical protein INS49_014711 [Diaporthe citri]
MTAAATAHCNCTSAINIAIDMASTTAASYGRWVHRAGSQVWRSWSCLFTDLATAHPMYLDAVSTILCHRIRTQSANLASQPGSHYQARYVQWPPYVPQYTQYAPAGRSSVPSAAESTILAPMITLRSNFCGIAKVYEKQFAPAPK